jgi:MFS family permease
LNPQPALLLLTAFGVQAATFGGRAAIPLVALQLGASTLTIGVLLSVFSVIPLLLSIPAGRWVDRVGARPPLLIGCTAQAIGLLIAMAWPNVATLGAASFLLGCGHMILLIALNNAAGAVGDAAARAAMFNRLTLVYSIGVMTGPLVAGFAIDAAGQRAPFLLLALPQVAALLWVGLQAPQGRSMSADRSQPVQAWGNPLELLRHPHFRRLMLISAVSPMCWELYYIFMPIYGSSIGLSASAIGSIMGAFAAAIVAIRAVMTPLQKRLGTWPLLAVSLIGSALMLATMPFAQSGLTLGLASFAFGLMVGVTYPLQLLLIYDAAPEGRKGEATGLRQSLMFTVALAAPTAVASLSTAVGFAPVVLVVAGLVFGAGSFAWRIGRRPRPS